MESLEQIIKDDNFIKEYFDKITSEGDTIRRNIINTIIEAPENKEINNKNLIFLLQHLEKKHWTSDTRFDLFFEKAFLNSDNVVISREYEIERRF